jgi:hypothetical protein
MKYRLNLGTIRNQILTKFYSKVCISYVYIIIMIIIMMIIVPILEPNISYLRCLKIFFFFLFFLVLFYFIL